MSATFYILLEGRAPPRPTLLQVRLRRVRTDDFTFQAAYKSAGLWFV